MDEVRVRDRAGVLLETYQYDPGPKVTIPAHVHEGYVWCLSVDFPGVYTYRGRRHSVPPGSVSVIHPFEPHASSDPHDRDTQTTFVVANVPAETVRAAIADDNEAVSLPYFSDVVSTDVRLRRAFRRVLASSLAASDRLAFDAALAQLVHGTFADAAPSAPRRRYRDAGAVRAARQYLHERFAEPVSLGELAAVAGTSSRTLSRSFTRHVGIPPHRYQLQLRIDRAKARLASGEPIADVAAATGFTDQSHLHRQFKRYVGFSPGRYRAGTNVQDRVASAG